MAERSEDMPTERPPGSGAAMGSGGAAPEQQMAERSEDMPTERPPGSGAAMESGGAAPEQQMARPAAREVLSAADVRRALTRIAHEIVERNHGVDGVVLIGLQRGGVWIANLLADLLHGIHPEATIPVGALDVSFHRDDVGLRPIVPGRVTDIPVDLDGRTVVLADDVLFTGRTVRAALEALNEYGRPRAVQLAVVVDRGHRELPIRPDFVGKNLPTSLAEDVSVSPGGVTIA